MSEASTPQAPTAAVLVIGDEILSGRTKDRNVGFIADTLTDIGIDLEEVRIVADREVAIVEAVRALSARYDYVFTSGGIGPTHDDITADSIAEAFGLPIGVDQRAVDLLMPYWRSRGIEPNESRLRMARIPVSGSVPIPTTTESGSRRVSCCGRAMLKRWRPPGRRWTGRCRTAKRTRDSSPFLGRVERERGELGEQRDA